MTGKLFVLSGPSGAGKGTLRELALKNFDSLVYSISCTTRQPRNSETDGVEYRFITRENFENRINNGEFLEYAHVHDNYYGTLKQDVINELERGNNVLLEIDVQGALQVREKMPEAVLIFIAPPSIEELEKRLRARHTETEENLKLRLKNAEHEMNLQNEYNHVIINDDLNKAVNYLREIFIQEGCA